MVEWKFQNEGAEITVKVNPPEAFLEWTEAVDVQAIMLIVPEIKAKLLDAGVKRVSTSISVADERVFKLAEHFGFVPIEILMVMPIVGEICPGKRSTETPGG